MNRSVILLFYFLLIYFLLDIIIFHTQECLYDEVIGYLQFTSLIRAACNAIELFYNC